MATLGTFDLDTQGRGPVGVSDYKCKCVLSSELLLSWELRVELRAQKRSLEKVSSTPQRACCLGEGAHWIGGGRATVRWRGRKLGE